MGAFEQGAPKILNQPPYIQLPIEPSHVQNINLNTIPNTPYAIIYSKDQVKTCILYSFYQVPTTRLNTRLNTSQLRSENFSGDLKTEVDRLQDENSAMAKGIMINRIVILVLAFFSLVNLILVIWVVARG